MFTAMASITHGPRRVTLRPRHLVGRARTCHLVLPAPDVSSEHAVIFWDGSAWYVRDLGSRNGTSVDGARLQPSDVHRIMRGSALAFSSHIWQLEDDGPPVASAVAADGRSVFATSDLLPLPGPEEPRVTLFQNGNEWLLEDGEESRPIKDGEAVTVDGVTWSIQIPLPEEGTIDAAPVGLNLDEVVAHFTPHTGGDVSLRVRVGEVWHELGTRAHHQLLYALARPVLDGAPSAWLSAESLARRLGMDDNRFNVTVFRIRQQFTALGILGAARVVERRPGSGQVRTGLVNIEVGP